MGNVIEIWCQYCKDWVKTPSVHKWKGKRLCEACMEAEKSFANYQDPLYEELKYGT